MLIDKYARSNFIIVNFQRKVRFRSPTVVNVIKICGPKRSGHAGKSFTTLIAFSFGWWSSSLIDHAFNFWVLKMCCFAQLTLQLLYPPSHCFYACLRNWKFLLNRWQAIMDDNSSFKVECRHASPQTVRRFSKNNLNENEDVY